MEIIETVADAIAHDFEGHVIEEFLAAGTPKKLLNASVYTEQGTLGYAAMAVMDEYEDRLLAIDDLEARDVVMQDMITALLELVYEK